jgi:hypothetical protein
MAAAYARRKAVLSLDGPVRLRRQIRTSRCWPPSGVHGQCDPDLMNVHELDLTNRTSLRETRAMTTDRPAATVSWGDFAAVEPDLAAAGTRHLDRANGAALLATIQGAAAPRLHPVTVGIVGDGLFVFVLDSAKRRDLADDGRYALHAHQDPAAPDEFSNRGQARRPTARPGRPCDPTRPLGGDAADRRSRR